MLDASDCVILYLDEPKAAPGVAAIKDMSEELILDKSVMFLLSSPFVP